ncbi:AI-2E family transporter [Desulfosarcina sp. OttesenSCG-928-G17]|nr:AI-2E family transporter [Desulfosarcina sp. OttesenSCG-928-G17]
MSFDIGQFARINKVFFIWTAFAVLLYLFRNMFGLVFITYVMCFITHSITHWFQGKIHIRRRLMVVIIYFLFLILLGVILFFITPRLLTEAKNFTVQLPRAIGILDAWIEANASKNNMIVPVLQQMRISLTPELMVFKGWDIGRGLLEAGIHYVSWFFLGLLFSFLIMLDLPRLMESVKHLRFTRLASVYEETGDSVVLFAKVVGESFRAQLMISTVNTMLTAIGLSILGIKGVVLLCTLVFICGLVPVLGVVISSVPIFLMAVNTGGIQLGLWAIAMIVGVHLVEAYILNPRIFSAVIHINPVFVLIILYVAHSLIGMWGMLLGVPISVYVYHQLAKHPPGENEPPPDTESLPEQG